MKRYEVIENATENTWMIFDNRRQEFVHDEFGDSFDTKEQAETHLFSTYDAEEELPFDILRRHHDVDGEYFYVWNAMTDEPEQDEDGNVIHFGSYDEAKEYVMERIVDLDEPEIEATAEVKETMFVLYNTQTGKLARQFFNTNEKFYGIYPTRKFAQDVADLLNANHKEGMIEWSVAQIKNVALV